MEDANKVKYGIKNVYVVPIEHGEGGDITYGTPVAWEGFKSFTLDPEGDTNTCYADSTAYFTTNSNNGYSGSIEMYSERIDEFTIEGRKSVSEKKFLGVKKMKYKIPKFLKEVKKFFMIRNTDSLFVQYKNRITCIYMAHEKFTRCHYENDIFVVEHYVCCKPQFRSLYRKFLDNEIGCFNYEDIKNGCNKFYLRSGEEYKKFIRIVNDM